MMPCIQASVKRLKEHVYNKLEDIPYEYVMKGDAPERISLLGTGAAVGPSVVSVDPRQPSSIADYLEAYEGYQGTSP
jgi:selenocysteine lyase/cysteine desulfurase